MNTDWKLLSPETLQIYTPHGQKVVTENVAVNKLLFAFGMYDEQNQAWWDSLEPNERDRIVCAELYLIQSQIERLHIRKNSLIDVRRNISVSIQQPNNKHGVRDERGLVSAECACFDCVRMRERGDDPYRLGGN